jgi:hypothetical protein
MAVITDMVEYYSLDEASGNALGAHASKTATDTNTVTAGTGKVSGARDFEQSSSQYFTRSDSAFTFTGDFTVSVWVKPESLLSNAGGYGAGIASQMTSDSAGDWWVSADVDGAVVFAHWGNSGADTNGRRTTGASKLSNGNWAHVVCRNSGGTFTVWVNGVSESLTEDSTASGWGTQGFSIGRQYTGGTYHFDGLIDELGIWGAAKSNDDIAWLYNSGSGRSYADIVAEGEPEVGVPVGSALL